MAQGELIVGQRGDEGAKCIVEAQWSCRWQKNAGAEQEPAVESSRKTVLPQRLAKHARNAKETIVTA
jgi:hypothetical protein